MSRIHDMGGRFGDGPVTPEEEGEVFHEDWHARALALTLAAGALGEWNIDKSRHARERLDAADYAGYQYYEKWLAGLADLLAVSGLVSLEELADAMAEEVALSPQASKALRADQVETVLAKGGPADRPSNITPKFTVGDKVRCLRLPGNRLVNGGHTRLPRYAAGAEGRILRYHGTHVFPDSAAHGLGEAPEPLYAVAIRADQLWVHPESPRDEVVLDLWQSYLEAL